MHLGRQVLHEICQGTMNGRGSDDVVVIAHEREVLSLPTNEIVGEQGQHGCWFLWLWEAKKRESTWAQVGIKGWQGGKCVGEEQGALSVLRLKRQPDDRQ